MTIQEKPLHIDIPVKLAEVKNVFSIASLSFEGDLPGHSSIERNMSSIFPMTYGKAKITPEHPIGSGFGAYTTAAEVIRDTDLSGKTAIVTGHYSDIGL